MDLGSLPNDSHSRSGAASTTSFTPSNRASHAIEPVPLALANSTTPNADGARALQGAVCVSPRERETVQLPTEHSVPLTLRPSPSSNASRGSGRAAGAAAGAASTSWNSPSQSRAGRLPSLPSSDAQLQPSARNLDLAATRQLSLFPRGPAQETGAAGATGSVCEPQLQPSARLTPSLATRPQPPPSSDNDVPVQRQPSARSLDSAAASRLTPSSSSNGSTHDDGRSQGEQPNGTRGGTAASCDLRHSGASDTKGGNHHDAQDTSSGELIVGSSPFSSSSSLALSASNKRPSSDHTSRKLQPMRKKKKPASESVHPEQSARAASPLLAVGGASIAKEHSLSESAVIVAPVAHRPKPPPPAIPSDVEPFKGQLAPFQEEGGGCLICAEPGGSLPKKCRECPRKAHSKCGPKKLRCPQCRYCYGCRKLLPVPNRSQQDDPAFLYSECLKCHLNWHSLCSYNIGDICPECSEPVY